MITVDDVNAVLAKSHPLLGQRRKIDWNKHDHVEGAYADVFGREREFRYASTRPVAALGLEVVTQHGPQWFYGSRKPIPPAMVVRFGLQPFDRALAQFVFDASVAMRKPIELAKSDRVKRGDYVHTLFRNPSGAWQLSYFEVGFGAAGHRESQDPVDLVKETLAEGFRHWLEGAVDRSLAVQQQRSESRRAQVARHRDCTARVALWRARPRVVRSLAEGRDQARGARAPVATAARR